MQVKQRARTMTAVKVSNNDTEVCEDKASKKRIAGGDDAHNGVHNKNEPEKETNNEVDFLRRNALRRFSAEFQEPHEDKNFGGNKKALARCVQELPRSKEPASEILQGNVC